MEPVDPVEERTIELRAEAERSASPNETLSIWVIAIVLVTAIIAFSLMYSSR
jgi:hypothetical protein